MATYVLRGLQSHGLEDWLQRHSPPHGADAQNRRLQSRPWSPLAPLAHVGINICIRLSMSEIISQHLFVRLHVAFRFSTAHEMSRYDGPYGGISWLAPNLQRINIWHWICMVLFLLLSSPALLLSNRGYLSCDWEHDPPKWRCLIRIDGCKRWLKLFI